MPDQHDTDPPELDELLNAVRLSYDALKHAQNEVCGVPDDDEDTMYYEALTACKRIVDVAF